KQECAAIRGQVAHVVVGPLEAGHGLLQVDYVNAIALREDEGAHLGVPAAGLVAEVDTGLQELLHGNASHGRTVLSFSLPRRSPALAVSYQPAPLSPTWLIAAGPLPIASRPHEDVPVQGVQSAERPVDRANRPACAYIASRG